MEAHKAAAFILSTKTIFHQAIPDFARGTELGDLFKEITMRIEEVAEPWAELIHVKAATARPFHIFNAVINSECQFLQRSGTSLADVVATNRDGIEFGREFGA